MPPKPLPLASAAAASSIPPTISTATAAAIANIAAASAKKSPLKRKSSIGSADSKTVKKKKTTVKAAKPGTASTIVKPVVKAADPKKKAVPKAVVKPVASSASPKKTSSKAASPAKAGTAATSKTKAKPGTVAPQQTKLQKAQQTKREIAHLDSIERAFAQDKEVWCPTEASGGWMYRSGGAELGAKSWMETINGKSDAQPKQQTGSVLLFDEAALLNNALSYNNLTSSSLTTEAYTSLLEQARRYALELLVDAQDYAMHASRNSVASLTPSDLLLAAEMRGDVNGIPSTLPRYEEMAEYAEEVNRKPLPPIPVDCYNGVALPPVEEQLTFRTFDVVNGARVAQKMMKGGDLPLASVEVGLVKRTSITAVDAVLAKKNDGNAAAVLPKGTNAELKKSLPSYGAGKGRQIAIHLKSGDRTSSSLGASKSGGGASAKSTVAKGESKNKRKLTEL